MYEKAVFIVAFLACIHTSSKIALHESSERKEFYTLKMIIEMSKCFGKRTQLNIQLMLISAR